MKYFHDFVTFFILEGHLYVFRCLVIEGMITLIRAPPLPSELKISGGIYEVYLYIRRKEIQRRKREGK